MFCRAEGIFHFRELDVGAPQNFRIDLLPVGTQKVTAAVLQSPLIALLIPFDDDRQVAVLIRDRDAEKESSPAVPFQKSPDPPSHLLLVSDLALLGSFGQLRQLVSKSVHKAVEDGVFLLLLPKGATENKSLLHPFQG